MTQPTAEQLNQVLDQITARLDRLEQRLEQLTVMGGGTMSALGLLTAEVNKLRRKVEETLRRGEVAL